MSKRYVYEYSMTENTGKVTAVAKTTIKTSDGNEYVGIARYNPTDFDKYKPSKIAGLDIATKRAEIKFYKAKQKEKLLEVKHIDDLISAFKNLKNVTEDEFKRLYHYRNDIFREAYSYAFYRGRLEDELNFMLTRIGKVNLGKLNETQK